MGVGTILSKCVAWMTPALVHTEVGLLPWMLQIAPARSLAVPTISLVIGLLGSDRSATYRPAGHVKSFGHTPSSKGHGTPPSSANVRPVSKVGHVLAPSAHCARRCRRVPRQRRSASGSLLEGYPGMGSNVD